LLALSALIFLLPFTIMPWPPLTLFHGTVDAHVPVIQSGIDLTKCFAETDFGPGFYTSTLEVQARFWANERARAMNFNKQSPPVNAAVMVYQIDRDEIARLSSLCFVRGHRDANDFWQFVEFCRNGSPNHGCTFPSGFYDVVYGPVAGHWRQRNAMDDSDQISFHTIDAIKILKYIRTV
jgi:hypothetical protein